MAVAASFGLASALSVAVLGDESGYTAGEHQKMKIAALEAMWHTEPAPAGFTLIGFPDQAARETRYAIRIPYVLGLIATRSLTTEVPGIFELVERAKEHIAQGVKAYDALVKIRAARGKGVPDDVKTAFEDNGRFLGYAYLLKRYADDPRQATSEQITKAAWDTVPTVAPLFWSFRLMVGLGLYFIALMAVFFWLASVRQLERYPWLLWLAFYSIPLPWIAAELGWLVAELGRQPWIIEGVLPTAIGVSDLGVWQVALTIFGFVIFYSVLAVVEVALLVKYIRLGPQPEKEVVGSHRPLPAE
jgi:cytochrome d ubiquinol oxidase subunit I